MRREKKREREDAIDKNISVTSEMKRAPEGKEASQR